MSTIESQTRRAVLIACLLAALAPSARPQGAGDPFAPLAVYDGMWDVRVEHPWSGAPAGSVDHLVSRCHRYTAFFACEQTVNGKVLSLMLYTAGDSPSMLHTRYIQADGRAAPRGDLTLDGSHWTYLDKPQGAGEWDRVENWIVDRDHIRVVESISSDQGKTWKTTNSGTEQRVRGSK